MTQSLKQTRGIRIVMVVLFAVVAVVLLVQIFAGTSTTGFETESSSKIGGRTVSDSQASNNSYFQFGDSLSGPSCAPSSPAEVGWRGAGIQESSLEKMSGMIRLGDGQVLENFDIDGFIYVSGDNVTIRNGRVRGSTAEPILTSTGLIDIRGAGTVIENVELDGDAKHFNGTYVHPTQGAGFTGRNLDIHSLRADGMKVHGTTTLERIYMHSPHAFDGNAHIDAIQTMTQEGNNLTVLCSFMDWGIPDGYGPDDVDAGRIAGGQGLWLGPVETVEVRDSIIISVSHNVGVTPRDSLIFCNVQLGTHMPWGEPLHPGWNIGTAPRNAWENVSDYFRGGLVTLPATINASC